MPRGWITWCSDKIYMRRHDWNNKKHLILRVFVCRHEIIHWSVLIGPMSMGIRVRKSNYRTPVPLLLVKCMGRLSDAVKKISPCPKTISVKQNDKIWSLYRQVETSRDEWNKVEYVRRFVVVLVFFVVVVLFVCYFKSHSTVFNLCGDVTIAGEGLHNFGLCEPPNDGLWAGKDI